MSVQRITPLARATASDVGGKAAGLCRLLQLGFAVPEGFVISGAEPGHLADEARQAFRALGGKVAVRSSALCEDGEAASWAGQYESVLNVEGESDFAAAVDRCLRSLHNLRASSYRGATHDAKAMSVVVQRMVPARAAGVVFTLDPISGRKDRLAIDAVQGLGESLVSGCASPDHYAVGRDGEIVRRELAGAAPVLSDEEIALLARGARRAEEGFGKPLDMEWAIDRDGKLFWLQARPIAVKAGDLHEFDWCPGEDHVYTTANIGEMIPGAVCPLTLSTTVKGIDYGNQRIWLGCGAIKKLTPHMTLVGIFNGHLFISLTGNLPFNISVAGVSPETTSVTLVGRVVPEFVAQAPKRAPFWKQGLNGAKFFRYILAADRDLRRHERAFMQFAIATPVDTRAAFQALDDALPFLMETYKVHLQMSAKAAVWAGVLEGMIAKGKEATAEQDSLTAGLLAGAGEVVSARLVRELEEVLELLAAHPSVQQRFVEASPGDAVQWLMGSQSGEPGGAFRNYLSRFGHRASRELCMREQGWADDPLPLVTSMRASLMGRKRAPAPPRPEVASAPKPPPEPALSGSVRWALEKTKRGVVGREYSKNLLVDVGNRFKRAYRQLARRLVAEGLLDQEDDLFFFTHAEIGRIARREEPGLAAKAGPRRAAFERQQAFDYPTVSIGIPEPLPDELPSSDLAGELRGRPVSPGLATGRARVVRSVEESAALQKGEILVAPFADVAWTPYFNLIAGLATEVGSAFCHGAVVAREYRLPTVVNLRGATRILKTGDLVQLDADHGILRKLTADECAAATAKSEPHAPVPRAEEDAVVPAA